MANLLDRFELDGLRLDLNELLGITDNGVDESIENAKTLGTITRVIERGPLNTTTKKYDNPSTITVYSGPADISPVTYRRDRQELGGQESIRIRQYRGSIPWNADEIFIDDIYTTNFSTDPWLVDKVLVITDVLLESEVGIRRISLVDTSNGIDAIDC